MVTLIRSRILRLRHALGTGRAIENARREHEHVERALSELAVFEARLAKAETKTKAA